VVRIKEDQYFWQVFIVQIGYFVLFPVVSLFTKIWYYYLLKYFLIVEFMDYTQIPSPCFALDEKRLIQNLATLQYISQKTGIQILIALKGFAMWQLFPILQQYLNGASASSCNEAELCFEELKTHAHTYCVTYNPEDFSKILQFSSHLTFNSLAEFKRYIPSVESFSGHKISCGLRINPEFSVIADAHYNPSQPGSRLGIDLAQLPSTLPPGIEGIHVHCLCESSVDETEALLAHLEVVLKPYLPQIKWLNLGGGHLLTQANYPIERFREVIRCFQEKHPQIQLILELGTAIVWQAGVLVSKVLDLVENHGIKTLMTNISFAAHLPDSLLAAHKTEIEGASTNSNEAEFAYRIGGNSCLANDCLPVYYFKKPVEIGEALIFKNAMPYTMVKSNFFNGLSHPALGIWAKSDEFIVVKQYGYEDFKSKLG
jgi:carboxynorspermidine decarboxylase